jgi:multidrug resistance protein, MATE family
LGHLGTKELAASALASMFANVTGYSLGIGMASGLDTLCSQAHTGSQDPHALGKHARRAFLVMAFLCIPIIFVWTFTKEILVLFGQQEDLAELSATYTRYLIPGLFPYFVSECMKKYLQAQGIMSAHLYIIMILSPTNALLQYLFVWNPTFGMGFKGAPIALSIINILSMFGMFFYIRFVKGGDSWGEWSWADVLNVPEIVKFLKLGIPGIAMICSEWWAFEIVALAAGLLGEKILAAQTVILNTCSLTFMVPLGISIASSMSIG